MIKPFCIKLKRFIVNKNSWPQWLHSIYAQKCSSMHVYALFITIWEIFMLFPFFLDCCCCCCRFKFFIIFIFASLFNSLTLSLSLLILWCPLLFTYLKVYLPIIIWRLFLFFFLSSVIIVIVLFALFWFHFYYYCLLVTCMSTYCCFCCLSNYSVFYSNNNNNNEMTIRRINHNHL